MATLFTSIIAGDIPGRFIWADDRAVAFTTIAPISAGHTLVVPRDEVSEFTDASDDLLAHLIAVAKRIGQAQKVAFAAPRAALIVAGFEVPHLHVHVLPAWGESELSFEHADSNVSGACLDEAALKLRAALADAGHGAQVPPALGSAQLS